MLIEGAAKEGDTPRKREATKQARDKLIRGLGRLYENAFPGLSATTLDGKHRLPIVRVYEEFKKQSESQYPDQDFGLAASDLAIRKAYEDMRVRHNFKE